VVRRFFRLKDLAALGKVLMAQDPSSSRRESVVGIPQDDRGGFISLAAQQDHGIPRFSRAAGSPKVGCHPEAGVFPAEGSRCTRESPDGASILAVPLGLVTPRSEIE